VIGALLERYPRFANWLYGFTPPERGTVVLVHRRVYIVPARLGWIFAATLAVLLVGSINYALSLGFVLTFMLAGMGLVGMVHTARNLARIAVSAGRAEPVFAGEAAQFRLHLDGRAAFDRPAILARHVASGSQLVVDIDREQAKSVGMSLGDITETMQVLLGSSYVNDFDFNNRSYRVYVQADQQFRSTPSDIERYYVRTSAGSMMPLSNVVSVRESTAPQSINHFNLFRSAEINGSAAPGFSSGQALAVMQQLSDRALPQGFSYAWSGLSLEEVKAGGQSAIIFGLGLLLVYLTLAAQYESVTLPFIILLSVPLAILGALGAQWARGLIDDVYCQIGLVMLIGLSAKNGILVVEFAEQLRARGLTIAEAAVEAARIRLRPILMTSLAFILGVMPLVVASGAGREARHSVGTAVAGGMIASTFLNLAFIPVLYVVVKSLGRRRS